MGAFMVGTAEDRSDGTGFSLLLLDGGVFDLYIFFPGDNGWLGGTCLICLFALEGRDYSKEREEHST